MKKKSLKENVATKKKKKKIDDKEKQEKPQEQKQQETKNTTKRSNRIESSPTSAEIKKLQNEMASFEQDKAQFMLNQKVAENKLKDMRFDLIEQKRKLIEQERSLEESRTLSQSQAVLRKTQSSAEVLRKKQKQLAQVQKETNVSDQIIQEKYLNPQSLLNSNSFSEERNYYTSSNTDVIIPISKCSPEYLRESNDQLITNLESKVGEYERFKKLTEESIRRFRDEEKTYISENNKFQGKINKMEMELENYKMQLRQLSSSPIRSVSSMGTVNLPLGRGEINSDKDIYLSHGQRKKRSKQTVNPMKNFPDNKFQIQALESELNWYSDAMLQKLNQIAELM